MFISQPEKLSKILDAIPFVDVILQQEAEMLAGPDICAREFFPSYAAKRSELIAKLSMEGPVQWAVDDSPYVFLINSFYDLTSPFSGLYYYPSDLQGILEDIVYENLMEFESDNKMGIRSWDQHLHKEFPNLCAEKISLVVSLGDFYDVMLKWDRKYDLLAKMDESSF